MKTIVFILLFSFLCFSKTDTESWLQFGFESPINEKAKISVLNGVRLKDNLHDYYWCHIDGGIDYSFFKWLNTGLHLWYIHKDKKLASDTMFISDTRPYTFINFSYSIKQFDLSDRNRLEYQIVDHDAIWCYRNRLMLVTSVWKLKPYIADEVFWTLDTKQLTQNRLYVGTTFTVTKVMNFDTHYFWRFDPPTENVYHVIGINLKLKLKV